ncbi:MAG TPA: hypothetical protein VFY87_31385, partial [Geminicoccaceae bacterium]|nr:hypothetical protein [Geminicoccaceae bacterium]
QGELPFLDPLLRCATTIIALKAHVLAFVRAYNFAKHLKALRWRTPFQTVRSAWARDPTPFRIDPRHLIPGPHS